MAPGRDLDALDQKSPVSLLRSPRGAHVLQVYFQVPTGAMNRAESALRQPYEEGNAPISLGA